MEQESLAHKKQTQTDIKPQESMDAMMFSPRPLEKQSKQDEMIEVRKLTGESEDIMSSKYRSSIDEQQSCPVIYEKLI